MTLKPVTPGYGPTDAPNPRSAGRPGREQTVLDGGDGQTQAPTGYAPIDALPAERPPRTQLPAELDRTGPSQSDFGPGPETRNVATHPVTYLNEPGSA